MHFAMTNHAHFTEYRFQPCAELLLTYESFNKQSNGDNIKDKQIEDVLAILLQICGDAVPFSQQPVARSILSWFNMKACHSVTVNKCYYLKYAM
jgi:hypothetical protein